MPQHQHANSGLLQSPQMEAFLCATVYRSSRRCTAAANLLLLLQVTLGRLDNNSLTIQDSEVSGHHAVMRWDSAEKCWQVTRTGSPAA